MMKQVLCLVMEGGGGSGGGQWGGAGCIGVDHNINVKFVCKIIFNEIRTIM